jgi:hypothetical protein
VTVITASKKFYDQPLDLDLPELNGVKVVEADYNSMIPMSNAVKNKIALRLINPLKNVKNFISNLLGWEYDVRSNWAGAAKSMIKHIGTDFDVIVSTYGPDSAHKIASEFKKINPSLFWLADYRDLWSQNSRKKDSYFSRIFLRRSEMKVVGPADMYTTVSDELAQKLKELVTKTPEVVFNGFDIELDPKSFNRPLKIKDGCLHIIYTGRIYPNKRSPATLIKAIEALVDENLIKHNEVIIDFYGNNTQVINDEIGYLKYPNIIKHHGHVTRTKALELQRSADLLLLLESGDQDSKGFLTGKIFEYIGAGRPIISIGSASDSAIARVLNETRCGASYESSSDALAKDILKYLRGEPPVWFDPDLTAINTYSREYQAQRLLQKIMASISKE